MKIILIIILSALLSISGIYLLREKVFKVNQVAPKNNPTSFSDFYKLSAKDIDGNYYNDYIEAKKAGVNFIVYRCYLSSKEIKIEKFKFPNFTK